MGKKQKTLQKKKKRNIKHFLKVKQAIFIIEKLTRDIIERCKLPQAIELRKKLGYNHNDIMVREETSIAEKIKKLFPHKDIVLNKKFNNTGPDIWFANHNFIIENDEGKHENYDSNYEKKRESLFKKHKKHNFKIFRCNPNDPSFDLFKFLGEINLHILTLCEENAKNKGINKAINKVNEDF